MTTFLLTGGIGCGKSTVSAVFNAMGYPCYDSDSAMKRLYAEDALLREDMKKAFGQDIFSADGRLDAPRLAAVLFNDSTAQGRIEQIAYPRLFADFGHWNRCQTAPFTLFESALLPSAAFGQTPFDKILAVTAPAALRIERVKRRSRLSENEIRSRMARQADEATLLSQADHVFVNDMVHPLLPQITTFIHSL